MNNDIELKPDPSWDADYTRIWLRWQRAETKKIEYRKLLSTRPPSAPISPVVTDGMVSAGRKAHPWTLLGQEIGRQYLVSIYTAMLNASPDIEEQQGAGSGYDEPLEFGVKHGRTRIPEGVTRVRNAVTDAVQALAPTEQVDEELAQAHMAGQIDAGVDPSYSNAQRYAESCDTQHSTVSEEPCELCDDTKRVETDNNGPIVDCPYCVPAKPTDSGKVMADMEDLRRVLECFSARRDADIAAKGRLLALLQHHTEGGG